MILQTRELNHRLLAHTLQDRSKYNSLFYEFINKNTNHIKTLNNELNETYMFPSTWRLNT